MDTLKVAVGQFPASNDIEENKQFISQLVNKAAMAKVELLVLPEASMCSFASELNVLREMSQRHTPDFIEFIKQLSIQHNMHIVVGVLSLNKDTAEQRVQNQLLVLNNKGEVISQYNKIHVYDAFKFKESDKVQPGTLYEDGSMFGIFKIKEFCFGLINCYDLRFPELARALVSRGVNVLSISANWIPGAYKEMHWDLLLRTRAVENTSYVLASGQTAPKGVGQSMVIDPMGFVLASCGEQVGIQVQDLSIKRIEEVRELLPCLANRRLV
ncbi:carbon-nitrogen hydrolase family protein [Pelistega sp. MC2]|uniref:carbon-nitrogen hydrolase family protein n=1 Tax=Pelistega sp. MC2 TaxID=1720297 RepID=UPI0008D9622E|nr:carbon-nitrogen hydrolase family protein [Pelistega sp. MC2]